MPSASETSAARPARPARAFTVCGTAFIVAAAVAAAINLNQPFPHGWWLVAYLSLVGGVAQLILASGVVALARMRGARTGLSHSVPELLLWNAGTIIVALADLMGRPVGVLVGSVMLIAALMLFALELSGTLRRPSAAGRKAVTWAWLYGGFLVFMAASTAIGTVLAYRVPT
ncbi:MAG: hypothetical protein ABI194_01045 [Gemmatimonadaceae bacterium]